MEFPNEESKWVWMAAILDTDGSITLQKRGKGKTIYKRGFQWATCLTFTQTNLELIEQLREISKTGVIHNQTLKSGNSAFRLVISSEGMRVILPKLFPYLIKKRKQTKLILEALSLLKEHHSKYTPHDSRLEEIYLKLISLHEKGRRLIRR